MEQLSDISILVVDDSEHIRAMLSILVKKAGVGTVLEAGDGESAVKMYMKFHPSLVFLDNMLPKLSGMDVLKRIMAFDSQAKIIMVSAISTPAVIQEAKNNGASYYFTKPYLPHKVLEAMKAALGIVS